MGPTADDYHVARRLVRDAYVDSVRRTPYDTAPGEGGVSYWHLYLFRTGRMLFGVPTPEQEATLSGVQDPHKLRALAERLLDVATWDDLLKPE